MSDFRYLLFVHVLVGISLGALLLIERVTRHHCPGRVPFWRRIWIPVPMLLVLAGTYQGVIRTILHRVKWTPANLDATELTRFASTVFAALLVPLFVWRGMPGSRQLADFFGFSLVVWGLYLLWFMVLLFSFALLFAPGGG